jgi:putative transposase
VLDEFVVMPNHVHLIVGLGTKARQASPLRLGTVIGSLKAGSSRAVGEALWQHGYYEHIVRDEDDLARVREYIATNPIRWALDPENPARSP